MNIKDANLSLVKSGIFSFSNETSFCVKIVVLGEVLYGKKWSADKKTRHWQVLPVRDFIDKFEYTDIEFISNL